MIRAALAAVFVLVLPHTGAGQVRDRAPAQTGTASITGRVMSDTQPSRPLRRAVVTLNSADRSTGRTAVADDQGRFTIANLPAGSYLLTASKRGWVTMLYGARAGGRPGRSVALADGERVTANMQLPRGAVISGVVLDQNGTPLQGATLRVLRYAYAFNTGERRLVPAGASSWGPDDRGAYRIYGLAPGEYYIAVNNSFGLMSQGRGLLHLTSDVDVQEAQRAVQAGPGTPIADVPQRAVSVAPVFYPGTGVVAQATPVTLRAGEERSGIDFTVQYIGSGRVSGTVQGPEGPASTGARAYLVTNNPSMPDLGIGGLRSSNVDSQGRFDFPDVTPGQYLLAAHVSIPSGTGAQRGRAADHARARRDRRARRRHSRSDAAARGRIHCIRRGSVRRHRHAAAVLRAARDAHAGAGRQPCEHLIGKPERRRRWTVHAGRRHGRALSAHRHSPGAMGDALVHGRRAGQPRPAGRYPPVDRAMPRSRSRIAHRN